MPAESLQRAVRGFALSRGDAAGLGAILILAFVLRVAGIAWGLPPAIPEVVASDIRCSYAFDEDDILTHLSFTDPTRLDLDPRLYHWGTFHLELVLLALEAAERLGCFHHPWRAAYYRMIPGDFERVYMLGRLVSIAVGLAGIFAAFLLAREFAGRGAAFWTALLVAVSPAHLLGSTQLRVDLTATALVTIAAWLGLRAQLNNDRRLFFRLGLAAALAVAAKYPVAFIVVPVALAALWPHRFSARLVAAMALGGLLGCFIGQPYLFIHPNAMFQQIGDLMRVNRQLPEQYAVPIVELLVRHVLHAARFLIGPATVALGLAGAWLMIRRRSQADWLGLSATAGGVLSLVPLMWPLLRYQLPLLPLLALPAALALQRCPPRWRWLLGSTALMMPMAASLAQLDFMRSPHPANRALQVILNTVPKGVAIARLMVELPPLDRRVYPPGPNPFLDDLSQNPPDWVLTADLPDREYPESTLQLLRDRYQKVAEFRSRRIFAWATLGESRAPHDWKYTHPVMVLYQRRVP